MCWGVPTPSSAHCQCCRPHDPGTETIHRSPSPTHRHCPDPPWHFSGVCTRHLFTPPCQTDAILLCLRRLPVLERLIVCHPATRTSFVCACVCGVCFSVSWVPFCVAFIFRGANLFRRLQRTTEISVPRLLLGGGQKSVWLKISTSEFTPPPLVAPSCPPSPPAPSRCPHLLLLPSFLTSSLFLLHHPPLSCQLGLAPAARSQQSMNMKNASPSAPPPPSFHSETLVLVSSSLIPPSSRPYVSVQPLRCSSSTSSSALHVSVKPKRLHFLTRKKRRLCMETGQRLCFAPCADITLLCQTISEYIRRPSCFVGRALMRWSLSDRIKSVFCETESFVHRPTHHLWHRGSPASHERAFRCVRAVIRWVF